MKKRSMKSEDPEVSKLVNNGFIDADYTKLEVFRHFILFAHLFVGKEINDSKSFKGAH